MKSQLQLEMQSSFTPRKELLLQLHSDKQSKYKRYNGIPLRYAGGKTLAVGHVLEHLPDSIDKLVSPFMGGGSVEIACSKELGIEVIGYDIFNILTNYWQMQINHPRKLANFIAQWEPNKNSYKVIKERLKAHWQEQEPITDKLELAAHYWYNHNLSYGPGFLGWMSSIYECPRRYERLLDKVRSFSPGNLSVYEGGFTESIPQHSGDFLYCDPPYYLDGDSKMFRGIYPQRNFPLHHNGFSHDKLCDLLKEHKGGFLLSYNDCSAIRKLYADYKIIEVTWQYTLGQGEKRIGKNRLAAGVDHVKKSHELLIIHYG